MIPLQQSTASKYVGMDAEDIIIMPKKIENPCLESTTKQNMHRELLFNQRVGKNILHQKSELQKVLEKRNENQCIAERNLQEKNKDETVNNELNRVIKERTERLEHMEKIKKQENSHLNNTYLDAKAKLKNTVNV